MLIQGSFSFQEPTQDIAKDYVRNYPQKVKEILVPASHHMSHILGIWLALLASRVLHNNGLAILREEVLLPS